MNEDALPALRPKAITLVLLNRAKRKVAHRLLKLLGADPNEVTAGERPGDEAPTDPVVAVCEGPLFHSPYGFGLAAVAFPSFNSLLRPKSNNLRRLDAVEKEFEQVKDNYAGAPRKWFCGLLFEVGEHLYLYTDQDLTAQPGLDCIRFSDRDRPRWVCSLEAFVESQH